MRIIFVFLGLLLFSQPLCAQKPIPTEWKQFQTLYGQGKYQEGLSVLLTLASQFHDDPTYYYNLGTTYLQVNQLGLALAYLEKANRLWPHQTHIQSNLLEVQKKLQIRSKNAPSEPLGETLTLFEQIADRLSLDELRTALGLFGFIVLALWSKAYWTHRNLRQTLVHPVRLLCMAGFILTFSLYLLQQSVMTHPPSICIMTQIIKSGPGEHFVNVTSLEEGAKVRLLGPEKIASNHEIWKQIRYSATGIGWARASHLLAL
jgi:tetratricopeptide (TPR) repeat protein